MAASLYLSRKTNRRLTKENQMAKLTKPTKPTKLVIDLNVTKSHIATGKQSSTQCPIALALIDKRYEEVNVGELKDEAYFYYEGVDYIAELSKRAIKFIDKFDNNEPVKPFSFRLTAKPVGEV